jgi:chromate reductase, NAD(P)H dehydrogenase (quinone)
MKLFLLAASLRNGSWNKQLIRLVATLIPNEHELDLAEFEEFDMPLYNADMQNSTGLPHNTKKFIERMKKADGMIISSPEYNFSTPGTLKNLIDWVSRDQPMPWKGQQMLLMSASISVVGGNRGLWHTRMSLESCGTFVYPDMFSLATAQNAFDDKGELVDKKLQDRLKANVMDFLTYLKKVK